MYYYYPNRYKVKKKSNAVSSLFATVTSALHVIRLASQSYHIDNTDSEICI